MIILVLIFLFSLIPCCIFCSLTQVSDSRINCKFRETTSDNNYFVFESLYNPDWALAFDRKGRPIIASSSSTSSGTAPLRGKCCQFVKRLIRDSTVSGGGDGGGGSSKRRRHAHHSWTYTHAHNIITKRAERNFNSYLTPTPFPCLVVLLFFFLYVHIFCTMHFSATEKAKNKKTKFFPFDSSVSRHTIWYLKPN